MTVDATAPGTLGRSPRSDAGDAPSVIFLGAILGRMGRPTSPFPGGCVSWDPVPSTCTSRPSSYPGGEIEERGGRLYCRGALKGREVILPVPA